MSDTVLRDVLMSCHGRLGEQWFVLGLHLGISPLELEQLEHSLPMDWDKCCRRMLTGWWEKCGGDGATCKEKLIKALRKMELTDIAVSIQFGISCLGTHNYLSLSLLHTHKHTHVYTNGVHTHV